MVTSRGICIHYGYEFDECGIHDGIEYDYYPACFLVKPVGGSIKKQKTEIKEIRLFDLRDIPKTLAFVHSNMIKDYIRTKQNLTEANRCVCARKTWGNCLV